MEQLARLGIMSTSTELYSLSLALLSGELYIQKRNKLESISEGEKKKETVPLSSFIFFVIAFASRPEYSFVTSIQ